MTREEIILSHVRRNGLGLEIGAGCSPIAPKKQEFRVYVLDLCDKEALTEKYRPHGIAVENIEEVDFVWDGRPNTELIILLKELAFYPTTGSEFYVALSRSGELPAGTRLELLQQIDREQFLS